MRPKNEAARAQSVLDELSWLASLARIWQHWYICEKLDRDPVSAGADRGSPPGPMAVLVPQFGRTAYIGVVEALSSPTRAAPNAIVCGGLDARSRDRHERDEPMKRPAQSSEHD